MQHPLDHISGRIGSEPNVVLPPNRPDNRFAKQLIAPALAGRLAFAQPVIEAAKQDVGRKQQSAIEPPKSVGRAMFSRSPVAAPAVSRVSIAQPHITIAKIDRERKQNAPIAPPEHANRVSFSKPTIAPPEHANRVGFAQPTIATPERARTSAFGTNTQEPAKGSGMQLFAKPTLQASANGIELAIRDLLGALKGKEQTSRTSHIQSTPVYQPYIHGRGM